MNDANLCAIIIVKGAHVSFDINSSGKNLSNVQASAKSMPGGGGNTGYFQRGQSDEEILEFPKEYPDDSFERENAEEIPEESFWTILKGLFLDFIASIKNFFVK